MKKVLGSLAMVAILGVAGCSCGHTGVYEFDSIIIEGENEEVEVVTCKETDMNNLEKGFCNMVSKTKFELKRDGTIVTSDGEEETKAYYQIENDKLSIRKTEDDKWEEIATIEDGAIIMDAGLFKVKLSK